MTEVTQSEFKLLSWSREIIYVANNERNFIDDILINNVRQWR